ncbi:Protein FARL-11, partial [Aphelenchoides avenae]
IEEGNGRRPVRPSFADDVYAQPRNDEPGPSNSRPTLSSTSTQMCESALAQRRSAQLPKLKEISACAPSVDYTPNRSEMAEIRFKYADCDSYVAELAELYAFSEMDDWAINVEYYNKYMSEKKLAYETWSAVPREERRRLALDLAQSMESAHSKTRLEAARVVLYILQGAYGDFRETEDQDDLHIGDGVELEASDRGTGGKEKDCLVSAAINAYQLYEMGLFQSLLTMLLVEMKEPYYDAHLVTSDIRSHSRQSSISNPRSASNVDISDSFDRRCPKPTSLNDNESLRIVINSLYHMLESIRRDELVEKVASKSDYSMERVQALRMGFLTELDEPLEAGQTPLVIVLFEMMPSFVRGNTPHYPMKKVLLLTWKLLLATIGGIEFLRQEKARKRDEAGLQPIEDTVQVATSMRAISLNPNETETMDMSRMGRKTRIIHAPRAFSRQLACTSSGSTETPPADVAAVRQRGGGSSDEEDGSDGLPDVEGDDDDDVMVDKKEAGDDTPEANEQPPTPTVSRVDVPNFPTSSARGDLTPKAESPLPQLQRGLPWKPKARESDLETFLQAERQKFFGYKLPPGDANTTFGLPAPVHQSVAALRRHLYVSLGELQMKEDENYNRYPFTQKEPVLDTCIEKLYRRMLPGMSDYVIALLKIILAALPSSKAKADTVSILSDVLNPEMDTNELLTNSINLDVSMQNALEDTVRIAIDINRHKEIIIKSASAILILLLKYFRLNHIYQFENFSQHLVLANCLPLILKFLDQNICRYFQSKHEITPFSYPRAPLYYVRNSYQWPTLTADNVMDDVDSECDTYFNWRNAFTCVNLVRVLNKLTKWKHARTMMLVVFKSAPILKRCMRAKLGIFQLYVLKLLKMQARYLGRQWRRSNMDVISSIYMKVRHRLNDDWAFANETRSKSWDFQMEERELKAAVEKFNSRRYSHLYPILALEDDEPSELDGFCLSDFEPVDNSLQSVLSQRPEFTERFKRNYAKWVEQEVIRNRMDWDLLLS